MRIPHFVVDAFTRERFHGNPAAVCVLEAPVDDEVMRAIARENNLSETAFLLPEGDAWRIRWLTPAVEVDLCGHATLASAHVVLTRLTPGAAEVRFLSKSGPLLVARAGDALAMDFPARPPAPGPVDARVADALGAAVVEQHAFREDVVVVLESAEAVGKLVPDYAAVRALGCRTVCATARAAAPAGVDDTGDGGEGGVDFVSRFFAPAEGVDEDPVTGSAHCVLGPLWGAKLGKRALRGRQLSARGGDVGVELRGDRVTLLGHAVLVVEGTLDVG